MSKEIDKYFTDMDKIRCGNIRTLCLRKLIWLAEFITFHKTYKQFNNKEDFIEFVKEKPRHKRFSAPKSFNLLLAHLSVKDVPKWMWDFLDLGERQAQDYIQTLRQLQEMLNFDNI